MLRRRMSDFKRVAFGVALLALLLLLLLLVVRVRADEVSFVVATLSPSYAGSALALFISINSSLTSTGSVFVLDDTGAPVYLHVFSVYPPLIILFIPSALTSSSFSVYMSSLNPYPQFQISYASPVFGAYDDFDYDSGMWFKSNTTIRGGKAFIQNGFIVLNASSPPLVASVFNFVGKSAFRIDLNATGSVTFTIQGDMFPEWSAIIDGSDIYFVDENGNPIYYGIVYLDKSARILTAWVDTTTATIFMFYGGKNLYTDYRLF